MQRIELTTLTLPVTGRHLRPGTLADQLAGGVTLLTFLRHLGCLFCREMVSDLKRATEADGFPAVLLVTQSPPDHADEYFDDRWPDVRVICDPARVLHAHFAIARATFGGATGPAVWTCGLRAFAKGNRQAMRPAVGDPWLLPAMFLTDAAGNVDWCFRARHPGERPDYAAVPVAASRGGRRVGAS